MLSTPSISSDEKLSRFVLYSRYFRSDDTVKPDAFVPHPYNDLSVTRNLDLNHDQLWEIGQSVAKLSNKNLHGRAEVMAAVFLKFSLSIKPAPRDHDENHTIINGWPREKSEQKSIAQQIAAEALSIRFS